MTIHSGPPSLSNNPLPGFAFGGAERFVCRLRPRETDFIGCESPHGPGNVDYGGPLPDGDYVFEVRDAVMAGSSDDWPFTIDTAPPETIITGGPGNTTAATAALLFSAPGASGFSCRLDGGGWQPCQSPQAYSGLSLGGHRFEVRAVDAAANIDPTPAEHGWQVLRPGLAIPSAVRLATALARELVQIKRALRKMRLRALARRRTIVFRTFDALTAGTVGLQARARVRKSGRRRWVGTLRGKREVPGAGRHRLRATVSKKGRRLARRRQRLPLELRLSFKDLAGRSLWATSKLTLKR